MPAPTCSECGKRMKRVSDRPGRIYVCPGCYTQLEIDADGRREWT